MSFVYCIGVPSWVTPNLVKLGFSSDTQRRVAQLSAGGPFRLNVEYEAVGTRDTEAALHRAFADYRAYGEWFDRPEQLDIVFHLLNLGRPEDAFDARPGMEQLRSWMLRTGMTRAQVASACGVSEATIAKTLKTGKKPNCRHALSRLTDGVVSFYDWEERPFGRYYNWRDTTKELIEEHAQPKAERFPHAKMLHCVQRFPVDTERAA